MKKFTYHHHCSLFAVLLALILSYASTVEAQQKNVPEVLSQTAAAKVVPTSFYFAGLSAETQARNSAAARIGENRYVIAGLVDTSGYSTEISGKYEGFFITDSPINFGDKELNTGAYGFGFSKDGKVNIFDLSSKLIFSVATVNDPEMKRPRPLLMTSDDKGVRFYKGKSYVLIAAK